jgi:hypothetical protein
MSAVWTKEMAEEFLETEPDSMFPCTIATRCRKSSKNALVAMADVVLHPDMRADPWEYYLNIYTGSLAVSQGFLAPRDEFGRCVQQCPNCNSRMLFNQLECVKVDLESTKETQQFTATELHSTKEALEECKAESAEEKRRFAGAIAKMVEREMGDVRTQLNYIQNTFGLHSEKALAKKAASEAAKAALSASKHITLRLLMF